MDASPNVFKIGETVDELSAEQIEISVAVEIFKVWCGAAIDIYRSARSSQLLGYSIGGIRGGAFVAEEKHEAMQRSVPPFPLIIPRIVPPILAPVLDPDNEIERSIPVVVAIAPLPVSDFRALYLLSDRLIESGIDRELRSSFKALLQEPRVLKAGRQDSQSVGGIARHDVVSRLTQATGGPKDGIPVRAGIAGFVLEKPDAVGGLVGTGNNEVVVTITVCVAGNRPGPQAHTQINGQTRVVVP